jgi:photosystem II stability/assembly factor-like uncharacterized protein
MTTYGSGVLRSLDGGESWQPQNTRLLAPYTDAIEFSPNYVEDQTIIVGQTLGFGKSTNNAEFWQSGTILDRLLNVKAIAFFPGFAINNFLLIGTNTKGRGYDYFWHNGRYISHSGVWQSFDGGINWNATYLNDGHVNSLAISPYCQEDGTVFASLGDTSVLEAGIYKSTDSGTHWTRMNTGTCDPHVSMVHVSPSYRTDRTVFASTLNDGVIRSLDGGETWEKCPGTSGWVILDFVISPDFQMDRKIFAATFQQGMQVSGDGGNSWSQSSLETNYLTALAISPAFGRDQTVFTASYDGVFRSMDGGSSWDQLNPVFRYEDNYNQRVKYSEGWEDWWLPMASMWHFYITNNPGETAELRCIATNISWVGFRGPGQGMAEVYIDGMYSALVDLYDPVFKWQQVLYESELLDNGYHTIKIVVSENKNPMSSGHVVSVDAFNIQINP